MSPKGRERQTKIEIYSLSFWSGGRRGAHAHRESMNLKEVELVVLAAPAPLAPKVTLNL